MESDKEKSEFYKFIYKSIKSQRDEGVVVITDKQCVGLLKSYLHKELIRMHHELIGYITRIIMPSEGVYSDHVSNVFFSRVSVEINLPELDGSFNLFQYKKVMEIIDAYEKVLKENPDLLEKCPISLHGNFDPIEKDIDEIRKKVTEVLAMNKSSIKENIYNIQWNDGNEFHEVPDQEFRKENILFNINMENRKNIGELYSLIGYIMPKYYEDPFYHDALVELFPDFESMRDFANFARKIPGAYSAEIDGVTSDNLFEKLSSSIGEVLFAEPTSIKTSFQTLHEGLSILYGFDKDDSNISPEQLTKIEQVYPNYGMVRAILNDSNIADKINDNDFSDKSGYDEVSKQIINLAYKEKQSEIETIIQQIKTLNAEQQEIETDKAFQRIYPQKEKIDEEIETYNQECEKVSKEIQRLTSENTEKGLIAYPESNTLFQKFRNLLSKIFNGHKINESKELMSANTHRIEELQALQKDYEQKIEEAKREALQKEIEFKHVSKAEITLEEYRTQREAKMQENWSVQGSQIADRKIKIQERIEELSYDVLSKKSELKEFLATGLIDAEPAHIDEAHEVEDSSRIEGTTPEE